MSGEIPPDEEFTTITPGGLFKLTVTFGMVRPPVGHETTRGFMELAAKLEEFAGQLRLAVLEGEAMIAKATTRAPTRAAPTPWCFVPPRRPS